MNARLDADELFEKFSSVRSQVREGDQFRVIESVPLAGRLVHLATNPSGLPALLVPLDEPTADAARQSRGVSLRAASAIDFVSSSRAWREPAAVLECRDENLIHNFAAMVVSVVGRLAGEVRLDWHAVAGLYAEWESLFARQGALGAEGELGLWGELWVLSRAPEDLILAWMGPAGDSVDIVLPDVGFEVKASRRADSHLVSQSQVGRPLGTTPTYLVSIRVVVDPLQGSSVYELVRKVSGRTSYAAAFEEKLAATGFSRDDVYTRRFAAAEIPRVYDAASVPRVRDADPGVSNLRYRVDLDPASAVAGTKLDGLARTLGLSLDTSDYPCA